MSDVSVSRAGGGRRTGEDDVAGRGCNTKDVVADTFREREGGSAC